MSILGRLFGSRSQEEQPLARDRLALNAMAERVVEVSGVKFAYARPLDQALIGTFVFGLIYAHGIGKGLNPPQVHALAIAVFMDTFKFGADFAAQAVEECIRASSPAYHDTMNAVMHRGIDGHAQLISGDIDGLTENIATVMEHFKKNA